MDRLCAAARQRPALPRERPCPGTRVRVDPRGIEQALGGTPIVLSARRLHGELQRACALLPRPIAELAVSQRTRAVIDRSWSAPGPQGPRTMLAEGSVSIPWISPQVRTLDHVFGNLVRSLLAITKDAGETDLVEVYDG